MPYTTHYNLTLTEDPTGEVLNTTDKALFDAMVAEGKATDEGGYVKDADGNLLVCFGGGNGNGRTYP